jgi:hypothetical protein
MSVHYPKSGHLYLLNELNKANENIMCLIDLCVQKDQRLAELEALIANNDPEANVVSMKP